ncbi:MAG: beta-propeller domain-containing protein [Candidatus Dojkabacteria bacterium]
MKNNKALLPALFLSLFVILVASSVYVYKLISEQTPSTNNPTATTQPEVRKFKSEQEFKEYLTNVQNYISEREESSTNFGGIDDFFDKGVAVPGLSPSPDMNTDGGTATPSEPSTPRHSETNNQVLSIDEPDIVKTDGKNIYISEESPYYYLMEDDAPTAGGGSSSGATDTVTDKIKELLPSIDPAVPVEPSEPTIARPPEYQYNTNTKLVTAINPASLKVNDTIKEGGQLLLMDDTVVVLGQRAISGYKVKDNKFVKSWSYNLAENTSLYTSRQSNGALYLVTMSYLNSGADCVVPLLLEVTNTSTQSVRCMDIYYPTEYSPTGTQANYTIIKMDKNGDVDQKISYLVGGYSSTLYMSENAIYLTYLRQIDGFDLQYTFVTSNASLFTPQLISEVKKLKNYELRASSKLYELNQILNDYYSSLSSQERTEYSNAITQRFEAFIKTKLRQLDSTGIIKFDADTLEVTAKGSVPGTVLNQFSLDEYQGNLRIATTLEGSYWQGAFSTDVENQNDLYILNSNLKQRSAIQGLGIAERIYSARFVKDKAYLVTFRQIDPFYVLDLSDADNPEVKGELKIPGYSSYLHPLSDNLVLGVGQDSFRVKLSLFDVSNPSSPIEKAKYTLSEEYWSQVENNHHAFLNDSKHSVFYIPGTTKGYIFSYANANIELKKVVDMNQPERALYIGDTLYLIGKTEIIALDELNWTQVGNLKFDPVLD